MVKHIVYSLKRFFSVPFNRYLVIALAILALFVFFSEQQSSEAPTGDGKLTIQFFYSPSCPHCAAQKQFHPKLLEEFPEVRIVPHDVTIPAEVHLLRSMAQNYSISDSDLGVPATFIGNYSFIGFRTENTTGAEIRAAVQDCLKNGCGGAVKPKQASPMEFLKTFDIPFIGKTDLSNLSLPVLAAVLGFIDGFNPCAMWVLVYLISLVMELSNKRRMIWVVVGTFVFASGILYFLFMTAWLNAFLLLGYMRIVTISVGAIALGAAILSFKEFIETHGSPVCEVVDISDKKKLMNTARELLSAPMTWTTMVGIIVLAFTVNSIEFVCSSAIPAAFTQTLALSNISTLEHYFYIALYDFFFMLDDLIVFGFAAFTLTGALGDKYVGYCKIIGAIILLLLGLMLLFAPNMLV